jgi:hypothetical protein
MITIMTGNIVWLLPDYLLSSRAARSNWQCLFEFSHDLLIVG